MGLTNAQYETIMREYEGRRQKNRRTQQTRLYDLYESCPRLRELDDAAAEISLSAVRQQLNGDESEAEALHHKLLGIREQKMALLRERGLPKDYLDPIYDCPDCRDTGYIGTEKCHCMKQAMIHMLYPQSHIEKVLETENFQTFSLEYYSDQQKDTLTGLSARETAERAVERCRHFVAAFDEKPKNLFLYGETGVGKTFLSHCVAKELLDSGRSVVYFTSFQLFDLLSKTIFEKDSDAVAAHQDIFDCDLLIIDDLGTELPNSFTESQLFLCINERLLREKSTIISTNLNISRIADIYSERTLSRIGGSYDIVRLTGDDIRMKKRHAKA